MSARFDWVFSGEEIRKALSRYIRAYAPEKYLRDGESPLSLSPKDAAQLNAAVTFLVKKIKSFETVSEALRYVAVDVLKISMMSACVEAGLSENAMSRYASGRRRPSYKTVLALCLSLRLPPVVTRELVRKAHYAFLPESGEDSPYVHLIDHCWAWGDMAEINRTLIAEGSEPLTNKSDD